MPETYSREHVIAKFSEALGRDKAASLIEAALREAGLERAQDLGKQDILTLSVVLKRHGGIVGIIANCLASEAHLMLHRK